MTSAIHPADPSHASPLGKATEYQSHYAPELLYPIPRQLKRSVDAMNGSIAISTTKGHGTRFRITLPLTLAIIDGMSLRVGQSTFVLPLNQVVETLPLSTAPVKSIYGHGEVVLVRGDPLPMVRLARALQVEDEPEGVGRPLAVILETGDVRFALYRASRGLPAGAGLG